MIKEGRNRELLLNERITHLEQQCEAQLLKTAVCLFLSLSDSL